MHHRTTGSFVPRRCPLPPFAEACDFPRPPPTAGIQHLLLLCLLRLAVLLCVGAVSYQAQRRRRASEAPSPPFGTTTAGGSNPATPRGTLAQAALYLQVAWLASELLLGSALLVFYPHILGKPRPPLPPAHPCPPPFRLCAGCMPTTSKACTLAALCAADATVPAHLIAFHANMPP